MARLHNDPAWQAQLAHAFTGTTRINLHLAPPVLAKPGRKIAFGPWMLRVMVVLQHGKALRGTLLDPFGHTAERRMERALIGQYRAGIERLLATLHPTNYAAVCDWAEAASGIKGFGHVKLRNIAATRARWEAMDAPHV